MAASAEKTFDNIEHGLEGQVSERDMKHAYSLHGSTAAYRRAITELLFFASVGGPFMLCFLHVNSMLPLGLSVADHLSSFLFYLIQHLIMIAVTCRCCEMSASV